MERPSISVFFADLPDPRVERTRRHDLLDIVVISVLAVICGANHWPEIADFAKTRKDWLREFLRLPSGVPGVDTFRRVFAALDVGAFNQCFMEWTQSLTETVKGKLVAIDGKTLRGSHTTSEKNDARHIVSAWVSENHIVFGQLATEAKSNEITAIPKLVKMLDLTGATVTIDAMGCQHKIVDAIIDKHADYLIAVKDNQPKLREEVEVAFATASITHEKLPPTARYESTEKAHGRHEVRRVLVLEAEERLSEGQSWRGLRSLVWVESERTVHGQHSREDRYYISSVKPDAAVIAKLVRGHWGIENQQHWTLDMAFDEDRNRTRKKNGPDNFALLRRIALNLLKAETSTKRSIQRKRLTAGWDAQYLLRVLEAAAQQKAAPPAR
jgi:predicted transposase YbfD/YdcC